MGRTARYCLRSYLLVRSFLVHLRGEQCGNRAKDRRFCFCLRAVSLFAQIDRTAQPSLHASTAPTLTRESAASQHPAQHADTRAATKSDATGLRATRRASPQPPPYRLSLLCSAALRSDPLAALPAPLAFRRRPFVRRSFALLSSSLPLPRCLSARPCRRPRTAN